MYIGLGSNLGNRAEALNTAVGMLKDLEHARLAAVSPLYETSPVGIGGRSFFNAVVEAETGLGAKDLLGALLDIEKAMGREREPGNSAARVVDLDLLLYGGATGEEKDLTIPHPRMLQRRFVMEPLSELAPDLRIPPAGITAAKAARDLVENHPEQRVERLGTLEEVKKRIV